MLRRTITIAFLAGLILSLPHQALAEWRDDLPEGLFMTGRYFWAGGYSFHRPFIDEALFSESNLRLNGRYELSDDWKLEFAYQVDFTYYEGLALMDATSSDGYLDLRWPLEDKPAWSASHTLDRLDLNCNSSDFTLDIGRQRLAWGTALTMSFMDMFNPIRPGDPFVPEQPGTDAIRLRIPTGPVAGWDILYAWFDDKGNEAFAARFHDTQGDFESGWSIGRIRGEDFAAFETSGDVNDIGIRIEASWRDSDRGEPWLLAFETDYAPNSSTYLLGEVFYNGPGGTRPEEYDPEAILEGGMYPARWYCAASCTYNPGGLTTLGVLGLANLSDDSWFMDVSISHSLSNSADLRTGFQHYEGDMISEYGFMPDMLYIIISGYF